MAENKKWSEKALITSIDSTTEFCVLHGNNPIDNRRINAATLLATKAPLTNPTGGDNNYAPEDNPVFTGNVTAANNIILTNAASNIQIKHSVDSTLLNAVSNNTNRVYIGNGVVPTVIEGLTITLDASPTDNAVPFAIATTGYVTTGFASIASPTFTGTVKTPALAIGASGAEVTLTPTATELNYVDGVTSNIQTQLDEKIKIINVNGIINSISGYNGVYASKELSVPYVAYNLTGDIYNEEYAYDSELRFLGYLYTKEANADKNAIYIYLEQQYTFGENGLECISNKAQKNNPTFTGAVTLPNGYLEKFGTNYVIVSGKGTPTQNAVELQAAYNAAKNMPRYLGEFTESALVQLYKGQTFSYDAGGICYARMDFDGLIDPFSAIYTFAENRPDSPMVATQITGLNADVQAKATRTTVIVAPGEYDFGGTAFLLNGTGIDVVSLTGNADVYLKSGENHIDFDFIGIKVEADYIYLKGLNVRTLPFYIVNDYTNLVLNNCIGGDYSFGGNGTFSGTAVDCIGGDYSFGGNGGAIGLTAVIENSKLTGGSWDSDRTISTGAQLRNCINADGSIYNNVKVAVAYSINDGDAVNKSQLDLKVTGGKRFLAAFDFNGVTGNISLSRVLVNDIDDSFQMTFNGNMYNLNFQSLNIGEYIFKDVFSNLGTSSIRTYIGIEDINHNQSTTITFSFNLIYSNIDEPNLGIAYIDFEYFPTV